MARVGVVHGASLQTYGFPNGHPFGPGRLAAYWAAVLEQGLHRSLVEIDPEQADRAALERFHAPEYVALVKQLSELGTGLLDQGDTPAFPGCYEAAATVVGSGLRVLREILEDRLDRAFVPIGGLHHARRTRAGGFCIFNDCGILIETLRSVYGLRRIAYVDIDAHHGDGIYYEYSDDPDVVIVDAHEDGRFLYPGTGHARETGEGAAVGTKLNFPLQPGADDAVVTAWWPQAEAFLDDAKPEMVLFQCGADSLSGDPLTHLCLSAKTHATVTRRLVDLARRHCRGRLVAFGGGGYSLPNLAEAWTAVVRTLLED